MKRCTILYIHSPQYATIRIAIVLTGKLILIGPLHKKNEIFLAAPKRSKLSINDLYIYLRLFAKYDDKRTSQKKLLGPEVEILAFQLDKSLQGLFVDLQIQEGVGIKAWGWLQQNRNMKIGRIGCSQVLVNLDITNYNGNYR